MLNHFNNTLVHFTIQMCFYLQRERLFNLQNVYLFAFVEEPQTNSSEVTRQLLKCQSQEEPLKLPHSIPHSHPHPQHC